MKKAFFIVGIVALSLSLHSCDKYSEGGNKKKADANLTNIWQIDAYFLDGGDQTSSLSISNYEETFADDGTYTRIYVDAVSNDVNEIGSWTLSEDMSSVSFSGGGTMDLYAGNENVSTSTYTILKLTKKELWYNFDSGGKNHYFRMKAKE